MQNSELNYDNLDDETRKSVEEQTFFTDENGFIDHTRGAGKVLYNKLKFFVHNVNGVDFDDIVLNIGIEARPQDDIDGKWHLVNGNHLMKCFSKEKFDLELTDFLKLNGNSKDFDAEITVEKISQGLLIIANYKCNNFRIEVPQNGNADYESIVIFENEKDEDEIDHNKLIYDTEDIRKLIVQILERDPEIKLSVSDRYFGAFQLEKDLFEKEFNFVDAKKYKDFDPKKPAYTGTTIYRKHRCYVSKNRLIRFLKEYIDSSEFNEDEMDLDSFLRWGNFEYGHSFENRLDHGEIEEVINVQGKEVYLVSAWEMDEHRDRNMTIVFNDNSDSQSQELNEKLFDISTQSINKEIGTHNFCTECGNKLSPEMKFCGKCGQKNISKLNSFLDFKYDLTHLDDLVLYKTNFNEYLNQFIYSEYEIECSLDLISRITNFIKINENYHERDHSVIKVIIKGIFKMHQVLCKVFNEKNIDLNKSLESSLIITKVLDSWIKNYIEKTDDFYFDFVCQPKSYVKGFLEKIIISLDESFLEKSAFIPKNNIDETFIFTIISMRKISVELLNLDVLQRED